ncbi:PrsW family intramembrane metalloprotease [Propioniciclava soli]|uniref:PrsW family intramembrane metalloprotease n=1 Tax=Propioniciclava soli TaxID=2775081 RepID=A0ABZ3C3W0_9ACTN
MASEVIEAVGRRRNGLPPAPDGVDRPWPTRVLRSPWTWVLLAATLLFAGCLWWMYATATATTEVEGGTMQGINLSAIRRSARLALPTLAVWVVLFVWLDRFRPARWALWYLALGWGACVSTAASMVINTWAAEHMAVQGNGDPASAARSAVFSAPFAEEATKATVLFGIAILLRYRVVSKLQAVALAGLSAAGFAYTENILYFSRVIVYASQTIEAGDPEQALSQMVFLRGVMTAFGHPLFTSFTALGLVIGLRARSKVVRILAPVVGFLLAALGHMVFNFLASTGMDPTYMAVIGWLVTLGIVVHVVRGLFAEGRRHRDRLGDYVALGWLPASDVRAFSRQRTRWASVLIALTHGWRVFLATVRLQRTLSELTYLRDAQVRGLVDEGGRPRERELIDRAHELRALAITDPRVQKVQLPQLPEALRRLGRRWRGASPDEVPATSGLAPVGSPQYSPVDPRWGPPKG